MYTLAPFFTYSPTISARRCQATMLCHSVRSCHSSLRSLYFSLVARLNLATGVPLGEYFTSGSLPTFPTRITLFTLLGMSRLQSSRIYPEPRMQLKGKVQNCATKFSRDRCVGAISAGLMRYGGVNPDYLGYCLYPVERNGRPDRTFR